MIRIVLVVLVLVVLLVSGGMLVLGAFPPGPRTEQVQKVLSPARLSGLEAVTSAIPIIDVDDPAAAVARAANATGVRNPGDETAG